MPRKPPPEGLPEEFQAVCLLPTSDNNLMLAAAVLTIRKGRVVGYERGDFEHRGLAVVHAMGALEDMHNQPPLEVYLPNKRGVG